MCRVPRAAGGGEALRPPYEVREREPVDGWAAGNRIWCEFVHGKWRTRQGIPTAPIAQDPLAGDGK
jgi:hypothetical protein